MRAVAANTLLPILFRNGEALRDFGNGGVECGVEADEVGHAGKELFGLAHDVDGDGRVQRREGDVALHFVQHCQA